MSIKNKITKVLKASSKTKKVKSDLTHIEDESIKETLNKFSTIRNSQMPTEYNYPLITKDQIKLITYNVASLNAALKKGFKEYVISEDADFLCIQETKLQQPLRNIFNESQFKYSYFSCSGLDKKGYSGTAIFTKYKPIKVQYGLLDTFMDTEGRVITLEYDKFYLITTYTPNSGDKLVRLNFRQKWDIEMKNHLNKLEKVKPIIWAGDFNVSHYPIDLTNPDRNTRSAGFTIEERNGFSEILSSDSKRVDCYRHFHPNESDCYTYFSYRFGCRSKGVGWRLDYFVLSNSLIDKVHEIDVRKECYGASDHLPLYLILNIPKSDFLNHE